jgi:hypothetical protein
MSRRSFRVMAVGMAALVCAAVEVSAGAKVPGVNGRIAFEQADPASKEGDTFVFTANPDGSDVRRLGPSHTCCAAWSAGGEARNRRFHERQPDHDRHRQSRRLGL